MNNCLEFLTYLAQPHRNIGAVIAAQNYLVKKYATLTAMV